jgi:hypothetical protein
MTLRGESWCFSWISQIIRFEFSTINNEFTETQLVLNCFGHPNGSTGSNNVYFGYIYMEIF